MVIVSDDKTYFVNFDNVTQISIGINDKEEYGIIATTTNDDEFPLAVYKTEERAREVLEEILERLENWENLKVGQPTGVCSYRYIMPKE